MMIPLLRGLTLALVGTLLAGCATAYQSPSGVVWAYIGTSESVSSLRLIAYTATKDSCELNLAKDQYEVPKRLAWAQMTLTGCQKATVNAGSDYWVFSMSGTGMGASTLEFCQMARNGLKGYAPSSCAPISIQFLGR